MIKLKDLLGEFIFGLGATGGSGPVSKAQAEKRAADKTKKNTDTKDKADKNTTWKDAKIKNPATGNEISIKSALGYPKDSEVYIQAIKIGKEKYNVPNSSGEYNRYFDKDGKKREKAFENTIKLKDLLEAYNPAEAFNKKVSKMTDRNEHTGATIELAIYMDDRDALSKLNQIKKRQDIKGSIASNKDANERNSIFNKLLRKAKKELSEKDYKLINSSF